MSVETRRAPLEGRRALVTGASRGIGRAIAATYARAGAHVCAVASTLRPELGEFEVELKEFTSESFVTACDVGTDADVAGLVGEIERRWGEIDIVVNNAGVVSHRCIEELEPDEWDRVINVNLTGTYRVCRAALPLIVDGGSIINITSAVASIGMIGRTHYTASKAGMVGFSRSLCKEVGQRNIRVNTIAPGIIETDQIAGLTPEQRARYEQLAALGRLGRPDDIAKAAVFFGSEFSAFVSGSMLVVDGGI